PATAARSRCRHSTPLDPTLQHICPLFPSERLEGGGFRNAKPLVERDCEWVTWWGAYPRWAGFWVQIALLHGRFRALVGVASAVAVPRAGASGRARATKLALPAPEVRRPAAGAGGAAAGAGSGGRRRAREWRAAESPLR